MKAETSHPVAGGIVDWKMQPEDYPDLKPLTREIIGSAMHVSRVLGHGFVEKVYENALAIELAARGLKVLQQEPVQVRYGKSVVGQFIMDLLVEDRIVIEIKAVSCLDRNFELQCVNYLKATGLNICCSTSGGGP